jgi:hypothetical protein
MREQLLVQMNQPINALTPEMFFLNAVIQPLEEMVALS